MNYVALYCSVNLIRLFFSADSLSSRHRKCSNIYMFEHKMSILSKKPYQNSTLIKQAISASES